MTDTATTETAQNAQNTGLGTPSPPAAGSAPAGAQDAAAGTPATDAAKTFTQAELDTIISREKAKAKKAALEEAQAEAQKAQMTEAERLKTERDEAQQAAKTAQAAADQRVITMEAKLAALAAGADPDQIDYVLRLVDLTDVAVTDGQADVPAISAAVAKVKNDLPALFGVQQAGQANVQRSGSDLGQAPTAVRSFTTAELRELQKDPAAYAELQPEIEKAFRAGKIVRNT
jgi:hypothetical protein